MTGGSVVISTAAVSPSAPPCASDRPPKTAARAGLWLSVLGLTLLGYALAGKGWAYVGYPPLFIGEVVLFAGAVVFLLSGQWVRVVQAPAVWLLLILAAWGLLQTMPYLSRYGADALRDAVLWGYGAFAILVFGAILAQPARLAVLLGWYRRFPAIFLTVIPLTWTCIRIYPRPELPRWPWADVPVIDTKGGDIMVHVAGILAFWVSGFAGQIRTRWVLLLAACVILVGAYDRAGLLSFLTVFALCLFLKPRQRMLWQMIGIGVCGLLLLAVTGFQVKIPGREREVSFDQLVANLTSTISATKAGDLDETKEWRLEWWGDVYRYTVQGKYFWTGKGFGINLADDDGYQVEEDNALRNPHNGHLAMLARAGVPGFALWVLVQLTWAGALVTAYVRSRRCGDQQWSALFLFLLGYWVAFVVNASFDVYLEGPMGGIWFWTVYGVGLAAVWVYRHNPTSLPVATGGLA
jgi:hypothetical protein